MPRSHPLFPPRVLVGALVVAATLSCGDSSTGPTPPARIARVSFVESADSIEIGSTRKLSAQVLDVTGNTVSGRDPAWTSSDTNIAIVDGSGTVSGRHVGAATISATVDSVSGSVQVVVRPIPIVHVTIPSAAYQMVEGDTLTLPPAQLVDRTGATVTDRQLTYTLTSGTAVAVAPSGFITALTAGSAVVSASIDTVRVTLAFTVTAAPVGSVKVVPSIADVGVGRSVHTQSTAFTPAGAALRGRTYTYAVADANVATVNASGVITGSNPGSTTVTASTGGATFTVPVSVAALGTGAFHIDLRFLGTVSPTVRAAAAQAAARWEQVITQSLVPYHVVLTADTAQMCMAGLPAVNETVPNMIIYVKADSIDGAGKIAGFGGPCIIRDDAPELTALGTLIVDTADVAWAASNGVLADLVTHEMGHIIGIGTLWDDNIYDPVKGFPPHVTTGIPASGCGVDPEFIGSSTRNASAALGFTPNATYGAPIEATGGPGTCNSHWRASVFGHELMTGTLHSGLNPMSLVTIDALGDLGYSVAPQAADDFSILNATNPGTFPKPSLSISIALVERVTGPRFTVTRSGQLNPIRARIVPAP